MKYRVAFGTKDHVNITEHFGSCEKFYIMDIDQETDEIIVLGDRETGATNSDENHDNEKLGEKITQLLDCQVVIVNKLGVQPEKFLIHNRIIPLQVSGTIDNVLRKIIRAYKNRKFN